MMPSPTDAPTYRADHRYEPTVSAPRLARRFVEEFLTTASSEDLRETADLLTSEVVADAVRQAPSQIRVLLEFDGRVLRVEVSDDPGLLQNASAGRFERRTGSRLVGALANRWGSECDRDRTTTWFELSNDRIRPAA
jgi:hypothetical protein